MNKLHQGEVRESVSNMIKIFPSELITKSQTRKDTGDYSSTLVYKINEGKHLEHSGVNLTQQNQEFDCDLSCHQCRAI